MSNEGLGYGGDGEGWEAWEGGEAGEETKSKRIFLPFSLTNIIGKN